MHRIGFEHKTPGSERKTAQVLSSVTALYWKYCYYLISELQIAQEH
jgi:hypothetical protein